MLPLSGRNVFAVRLQHRSNRRGTAKAWRAPPSREGWKGALLGNPYRAGRSLHRLRARLSIWRAGCRTSRPVLAVPTVEEEREADRCDGASFGRGSFFKDATILHSAAK